jgi:alkylation response protein AidB-like acyl-CoA dehydrogenase
MDFSHTEERRLLAETIARYVADEYDIETRHAAAALPEGFSRDRWQQFAELGLVGALFSERHGGYGGAPLDIMVVFEELGRGLVVEPFLATGVLAGGALALAGNPDQTALLEEVIAGETMLAFAHGEPEGRYDLAEVTTIATPDGDGWRIDGAKSVVLNGDSADKLVVSARVSGEALDEAGIALFLLDADGEGISRRGSPTVDGGRSAEITFDAAPASASQLIGKPGGAYSIIEMVCARGILAVCAEALGAMQVAKDMTLDYLRARKQFGVPIGSFQALQHRMAEMLIEMEQARSAVINAAARLEDDRAARERDISSAKHLIGVVGRLVAEETIQMHGGIGMTWEYALGHYAKRLVMIDHVLGDTDHHLERFIAFS